MWPSQCSDSLDYMPRQGAGDIGIWSNTDVYVLQLWFVRLYLGAGSKWPLGSISLLWLTTVVVNFLSATGGTAR